jgi:DNA-binding NarL/FixJ family response regulator
VPKSARLTAAERNALRRLAGECRDLGDDAHAWRRHLYAGLARLCDGDLALGGEKTLPHGAGGRKPQHFGDTAWGWQNGFDSQGWINAVHAFLVDPEYSPSEMSYLRRFHRDEGIALTRCDVFPDRNWYDSPNFEFVHRIIGVDQTLWCYHTIPDAGGAINGIILSRAQGRRDFDARGKSAVRLGHALVAPLIGRELARYSDPAPSALPFRTRQVLRCLLEGDGDKQVATRLGISRYTVNEHTKAIYRHFGVASRSDLLARWVRRRWDDRSFETRAADLPPRVQQVLRSFLEGDSDDQTAKKLGLSRYTVNQYAKTIYTHFGITSRPELLARWIANDWGGRFAWADEGV